MVQIVCVILFTLFAVGDAAQPNIIFMLADDFGWNDIGFRNPDIISPKLDALAAEGIILNQSYVQPLCTPSRAAIMTGKYPFKTGMQHLAFLPNQKACAPKNLEFLPERLKNMGYSTHMIGKWHLGFCNWNCTPTARGFDTFYGFYQGQEHYFNRTIGNGIDFRDNRKPINPQVEKYSTYLYADHIRKVIQEHDKSKPLFYYMAFQSVHTPIEVPKEYEDLYPNIKNDGRRKFSGMVTAMDDLVGNVTETLKQTGLYDNTIIIFTADNGGWPMFSGNNYPLRGSKMTLYEGGTRATAFIHGVGLQKTGYTYDGLMHAIDWFPTIVSMAGGTQDPTIDGINMWPALQSGGMSPRKEFIYNIDDTFPEQAGRAAIRVGDFKLIQGFPGPFPDWYPVPESNEDVFRDVENQEEFYLISELFNLKDDPNERHNLYYYPKYRDTANLLKSRLKEYHKLIAPAVSTTNDNKAANPDNYNGFWSPGWC